MTLSIITINLNNLQGLKKTMESIVCQSFTDYEWIVIDGASTDGSRELIDANSQHIAKWVSEKDTGIYNAMNKGILMASGEYILFLNSGDWLADSDILSAIFATPHTADLCFGRVWLTKADGQYPMGHASADFSIFSFFSRPIAHSGGTFYRRQMMLNIGMYDEKFYMSGDIDFNFRAIFKHRCTVEYLDRFISHFDAYGISSNPAKDISWERNYIINKSLPRLLGSDHPEMLNAKDTQATLRIIIKLSCFKLRK